MKDYLHLSGITRIFNPGKKNEVVALDNLDLTVREGEFVTLLGPSGCGKTTALRIIAGFDMPTGGDVFIDGVNVDGLTPDKRDTAMVFQNYALFPHLSVYENIAYGLRVKKKSRDIIRNDVAMACQVVNLAGMENRFPGSLSGGQQQRVALARTLVMKPKMILFDEPLSNLDLKLRIQTRSEIKRVQQLMGMTVLYVTHDQSEALSMSDRIMIMNHGKIIQTGTPEEIYNNPANAFAADFIGNANFISAVVEETDERWITVKLSNRIIIVEAGLPLEDFEEGEEVYLTIKPEAIVLSEEKTDFSGIIEEKSFLGPYTEYKIEFEDSFINVHQPNLGDHTRIHKPGERVFLRFNHNLFRIYKK
ncbi:MAG: ABC transporter ATP-binding protein [Spirochaetales bacterium]|nr:ABC transporter ATP-binding protein [Spirochaetales bacterium]